MSALLLDVNVLVALMWPDHTLHEPVQTWFGKNAARGWATCPITQAGFVRMVSNPAFSVRAVSPSNALRVLDLTLRHPTHQFWPDDVRLGDALEILEKPPVGHQQITDAYLLALAIHKKGRLATLDRSVTELLHPGNSKRDAVELIRWKR